MRKHLVRERFYLNPCESQAWLSEYVSAVFNDGSGTEMYRRIFGVFVVFVAMLVSMPAVGAVSGSVVINEIMYNPASDVGDHEYLELHNPGDSPVMLTGMSITDAITVTFGAVSLPAGGYVVISPSIAVTQAIYGVTPVAEYAGGLKNSGETITLLAADGVSVIDTVTYTDDPPWPLAPDGNGPSLELRTPSADNNVPQNWASSTQPSPGAQNSVVGQAPAAGFDQLNVSPSWPEANENVSISVVIEGAQSADLFYRVMFGSEISVPMARSGSTFTAAVPGQAAGSLVRYRIVTDTGSTLPTAEDSITDLGFVVKKAVTTSLPTIEWFITDADYEALNSLESRTGPVEMFFPATIAYGGDVYTGVQMKIRGGGYARSVNPQQSYSVEFPSGHDFDAPALFSYPVDEFALKYDYSVARGLVAWEFFEAAGFREYQTFNVRIQKNGVFHAQYRVKEKYDGAWRKENGFDTGQLFKAEGDFKYDEAANGGWDKKNPSDDDLTDIKALSAIIKNNPTADQLWDQFDVPNIVNYWAVSAALRHQDQDHHNKYVYWDEAGTGLWSIVPWDLDHIFGVDGNEPCTEQPMVDLTCLEHTVYDAFWSVPEFREMYFRRLRTLMDGPLAPSFIEDLNTSIRADLAADVAEHQQVWGVNPLAGDDVSFLAEVAKRRAILAADGRIPSSQSAAPPIVITELQYNPVDGQPEFLELYNPTGEWIDLSLWTIAGAGLVIPGGTVIAPQSYAVFTDDISLFRSVHNPGADYLVVQYNGGLKGSGELLELRDAAGTLIDSVDYSDKDPWESYPDFGIFSLELTAPSLDNALPKSWLASTVEGGTPGRANSSGQRTPTMANATSLVALQSAIDYNQAEHEPILRLYAAFFNRSPDVAGARYWLSDIHDGQGASLDLIAAQFALSREFKDTYGSVSNEQYLSILYQNVLQRQPDPSGFQYWLGLLENRELTRGGVVRWVAAGQEFEARVSYPDLTP